MASYKAWKALERRTAKWMRGERLWRPDFGDSIPDGESRTDVWDCKAYARHAAITMFVEAEKKYREFAQGRRFSLVLFARNHPSSGDFVLMKAKDVEKLLDLESRVRFCVRSTAMTGDLIRSYLTKETP